MTKTFRELIDENFISLASIPSRLYRESDNFAEIIVYKRAPHGKYEMEYRGKGSWIKTAIEERRFSRLKK